MKRRACEIVNAGARVADLLKRLMQKTDSARISGIYRYPVKGLSPERLEHVTLGVGQTLPADRRYAIENGPSGFDPADPRYFPKSRFLMLMRNERLAALDTRYDDRSHILTVQKNGQEAARGNLETPEGRAAVENFFDTNFTAELKGSPKILSASGHSFSDIARKVVSIINLSSVAAIESIVGQPVNPLRFRANLYLDGWPAWHEFDLLGRTLTVGDARLKVVKRTVRCAAIDVDPENGVRDLNIQNTLMLAFNHADCGVYAEVVAGGAIAAGNEVNIIRPPQ